MNKNEKQLREKAIEGASAEAVNRFGSAVKEHLVSYSGHDYENNTTLKRGLDSISQSKVNPEYREANIKQQAGFSAEVKSVARKNADNIINNKDSRYIRTDDIEGHVNDPLFDVVERKGNNDSAVIPGSEAQMKFVGNSPQEMLKLLESKEYRKYLENDAILDVPDDYYDALIGVDGSKGLIDQKIEKLQKQLQKAESDGNGDLAKQLEKKIEDNEKIKHNLRKSGLTSKEAIEAREHPRLSVTKDVVKIANQAGLQQAGVGAAVSGSVSIIKNLVEYTKGDIDAKEASKNVAKDIGTGAVTGYVTAFSGTVIKGVMQNSSKEAVRSLAKTNLASGMVITTKNVAKTMISYTRGELTGAECIEKLGKDGIGELGAAMYSSIALAAVSGVESVAIKVVAGMVGSSFGYMAATAVYKELATSLKEYEYSKQQRIVIERECAEAIALIKQYRLEMKTSLEKYFSDYMETFLEGFDAMDNAIAEDDIEAYIVGNNMIQTKLSGNTLFNNMEEFNELMLSEGSISL